MTHPVRCAGVLQTAEFDQGNEPHGEHGLGSFGFEQTW